MEEMPSGLTPDQGRTLVELARFTLMERFNRRLPDSQKADLEARLEDDTLQVHSGTFVTLKIGGQLRGCIGNLVGYESIVDGIRSNTVNAAFHDPRFRRLTSKELDRITIEVSVLTLPQPLEYSGSEGLVAKLRPGIDGVTIRKGAAGSTFLPQVWEQLPDPETFLSHLCMKAGLAADAWHHGDLEIETYQVQYFEESP